MATVSSVTTDLTTCPICLDVFDNPKSLPCLHAFCLKCLQGHFKDECLGDEVPCPLCRKEFEIPSDGLGGLQHHFFIQQLVDVRRVSSEEFREVPCAVCLEESDGSSKEIAPATVYCVDCKQKLCERCSRPHRRMTGGAHQLKPLGAELEQELVQLRASSCDKHKDEQVKLYCHQRNENICVVCFAVHHRQHENGEIPEVAKAFRPQINADDEQIVSGISALRQRSEQIERDLSKFHSDADNVKKTIFQTGDEIKRIVDDQISELVSELQSVKSDTAKQAQVVQDRLKLALVSMESFHTYSRELLEKGRPSDVTRAAGVLHDRATELLQNDVTAFHFRPGLVTFTATDVTQLTRLMLVGKLTIRSGDQTVLTGASAAPSRLRVETEREKEVCQQLKQVTDTAARLQDELRQAAARETQPQSQLDNLKREMNYRDSHEMGSVIHTMSCQERVSAVTLLDNLLYVLLGSKSSEQIAVYDTDSYKLQRNLSVPGLGRGCDIVACSHNRCAYISDDNKNSVHRLALPGAAVTSWPVIDEPDCLSITGTHSVLVTSCGVRKIKEFSTHGKLLQQLQLPQDVESPWHTVQLSSGQFIVCHGGLCDSVHRVCLIGSDGQVVKSFGGPQGSDSQQMNVPHHLAVDRNGFVFVADSNNRRVLLLSPSLTYVRDVVSRDKLNTRDLCLDADKNRLYVAFGSLLSSDQVAVVNV